MSLFNVCSPERRLSRLPDSVARTLNRNAESTMPALASCLPMSPALDPAGMSTRTRAPSALPNGWKSISEPITTTASAASASRPTRRLAPLRRRRAGPAGVSPGGVTIGRAGRRTRRIPIGRSVSSSSAPAGAAGGAGGLGWMRSTPSAPRLCAGGAWRGIGCAYGGSGSAWSGSAADDARAARSGGGEDAGSGCDVPLRRASRSRRARSRSAALRSPPALGSSRRGRVMVP